MNAAVSWSRIAALFVVLAGTTLLVSRTEAAIIASSGVNLLPSLPAGDLLPGTQPPTVQPIFAVELVDASVQDPAGLSVDHDGSDIAMTVAQTISVLGPGFTPTVLLEGTRFDSYIFHFDPADVEIPTILNFYINVSVEFSTPILGVQFTTSADTQLQRPLGTPYEGTLEFGDLEVNANGGPPGAYFPSADAFRGLEEDSIAIDLSGHRITLFGKAFGTEIDQLRVLVAVVPEPGCAAIFIATILTMAASRRRS